MGNFCTNCGAKLGKDFKYCVNCGTKVEEEIKLTQIILQKIEEKEAESRIKQPAPETTIKKDVGRQSETQNNQRTSGGYCGFECIHYYEEFMDSGGGIVGDFDSEGYVEYYCNLGYPLSDGSFCKYFE